MRDAVILEALRTPIGKRDGGLRNVHPVDLLGDLLISLLARTHTDPGRIEDVVIGCVDQVNASQISDAAGATLIASAEMAAELDLRPRARFKAFAVVGVDPVTMLTGPIPATRKVLRYAGLGVEDIDLFEVNEAFSPVVLAWQAEIGAPWDRVNVNGGAIALGHPVGATGARIVATLLHELERRRGRYGLVTICEGGGMANAAIVERLDG